MKLNSIKPKAGATHYQRRVGRGIGSGHGAFSGHGAKGQGARQGGNVRPGFEGGQTPLIRRIPKLRGFKNINHLDYQIINVSDLNLFKDGDEVNALTLLGHNLVRHKSKPIKLLGDGTLERKLTIKLHKVSASAKEKVVKAGGKVIS